MKRVQQGFTLIELMIVVAIVGILAAIALPAYQDYVIRSKMSETEAAIAACKTSVAEFLSSKGSMPASNDEAGCSSTGSQYVAAGGGWPGTTGPIVYTSAGTGASPECTLSMAGTTAGGAITRWTGTYASCAAKYVPSSFR